MYSKSACVHFLASGSGVDFEILVIDNGSSDGSQQMVRGKFPQVQLVENKKNLGFAGGNNKGISPQ